MSKVDWHRVEEIYAQLIEGDANDRQARLDIACAGESPELRAQVEYLLRSPPESEANRDAQSLQSLLGALARNALDAHSLAEGTRLGNRFTLVSVLGAGGMGMVYRALDDTFTPPREVAIKTVLGELMIFSAVNQKAGEEWLKRFRFEANALSLMEGQHFVQIHDIGESFGQLYIVMELVRGGSLADRGSRTLSATRAASLIETLAEAIAQPHILKIVHRDLKPANILMTPNGLPKITDFGIAKFVGTTEDDSSQLSNGAAPTGEQTQLGRVLGTNDYMAPEQWEGDPAAIGPAADIYALGAILYELLSGDPPFATIVRDRVHQALSDTNPARPALAPLHRTELLRKFVLDKSLRPSALKCIPPDLEAICFKCLAKDSSQRYLSATDLAEDLARFRDGMPVEARPVNAIRRFGKLVRRNPFQTGVLALLTLILLLAPTLGVYAYIAEMRRQQNDDLDYQKRQVEGALGREQKARQGETRARREVASLLYLRQSDLIHEDILNHEYVRADRVLGEGDPVFTHCEWYYLRGLCPRVLWSQPELWAGELQSSAEQGLTCTAIASDPAKVVLWSQEHPALASIGAQDSFSGWNIKLVASNRPLTRLVTVSGTKSILVWDRLTGKPLFPLVGHKLGVTCAAFSNDGNFIATGGSVDHAILLWNAHTGDLLRSMTEHQDELVSLDFTGDDSLLVSVSKDGTIRTWHPTTGERITTIQAHQQVTALATSPNGIHCASAGSENVVRFWDLGTGMEIGEAIRFPESVHALAFTVDGQSIAVAGRGEDSPHSTVGVWTFHPRAERISWRLPVRHSRLCFVNEGNSLAVAGSTDTGQLRVWEVPLQRPYTILHTTDREQATTRASLTQDSARLAFATEGGVIHVVETATGRLLQSLKDDRQSLTSVGLSPDGGRLVAAGQSVRVWDVDTGRELLDMPLDDVCHVQFDSSGKRLLCAGHSDRTVRICDAMNGRVLHTLTGHKGLLWSASFSSDGNHIASADNDGVVKIWNTSTGQEDESLPPHNAPAKRVLFSNDSNHVISASEDKTIRIWDRKLRKSKLTIDADAETVHDVSISADGRRIASVGGLRLPALRIWDAETGQQALSITDPELVGLRVTFSPDNQRIVIGGRFDGTVRVIRCGSNVAPSSAQPLSMVPTIDAPSPGK